MSKPISYPPFTKEEMGTELREILFIQASQIAHAGFEKAAHDFIGFEFDFSPVSHPIQSDFDKVDLSRFHAHGYLSTAYDFAFQVGHSWHFSESENHDVIAFSGGITPEASSGEQSPFLSPESRCRHVVDMAIGRWNLECDDGRNLTVRHLALLAGMTEATVRNSLSNEQIRTQGKPAALASEVAAKWLSGRKGFVPTRHEQNKREFWDAHTRNRLMASRLLSGMRELLADLSMTPEALAKKAQLPARAVSDFLAGQIDVSDLRTIEKIGAALDVDVPYFVGQTVEMSLRATN
jgi:hypothetical protein